MAPEKELKLSSFARQIILLASLSILPTGAVGVAGSNVSGKLDKLADGQSKLEERFARLEGAAYDTRVKELEASVATLREHVAGLMAKERK